MHTQCFTVQHRRPRSPAANRALQSSTRKARMASHVESCEAVPVLDGADSKLQPRRRRHERSVAHQDLLAELAVAKETARKALANVRKEKKAANKRHRRLMTKASKLSMAELAEIAQMKGMRDLSDCVRARAGHSTSSTVASTTTRKNADGAADASAGSKDGKAANADIDVAEGSCVGAT